MHYERYEITPGDTAMVYEFVSQGPKGDVKKVIIYSPTNIPNFFNLGFGDKNDLTGQPDDQVVTNNGDSIKVMATVASTLLSFTEEFPGAMIFATGSTKSRTRLYRIGISNNLETIRLDFLVYGFVDDGWEEFAANTEYKAFLVIRKKRL
ncbi:hypothetical protein SAMN04487996_103314 [Dyadobacter soli]|uniref:Uncharacterized protein n=1 Tax=Dyadobacter soli TaxID=659014 RepID=A0A1G7A2H5_9BACT|nr:hypothetical protein [Dyadobacter soli]SDE08941.1 hypothetical protein SAMN04487996_103314 [Dyadobacter soli]